MIILLAYLVVGLLVLILHPKLRSIVSETLDRREGTAFWERGVVFAGVLVFFVALWPLTLIVRGINTGREERRLSEMKEHVAAGGRETGESDGVLMTYRGVIEKQFGKVAEERGERIPGPVMREIVLHYVDHWVSANEHRLGLAMPFLINGGLSTYRREGLDALLSEIRSEKTLFPKQPGGMP